MKILVVDDDKNFLILTKHTLENLKYKIRTTQSPMEALSILIENKENYKLAILDVKMPLINGITLRQKIRIAQPNLKIIGVSGYHIEPEEKESFDYFLSKPFKLDQLREVVFKASFPSYN